MSRQNDLRPTLRKLLVGQWIKRYRVSVRSACAVVKHWRSGWYYVPNEKTDKLLFKRIDEIAATRLRYGLRTTAVGGPACQSQECLSEVCAASASGDSRPPHIAYC